MEGESQVVGPVSLSERILFIDVLRGIALFGILTANMRGFFAPLDAYMHIGVLYHSRADVLAQALIDILIQGKFLSIFSFLFGMGFAIQMSRAEARGARFLEFYPRRLLALALFGLIHGILIWAGDILLTYALSGAILLLFRYRGQKKLLWWAGGLMALPVAASLIYGALYFNPLHRAWMERTPPDPQKYYQAIDIYAHGTVRQILAQNWVEWKRELPTQGFAIYAVALFMLGMWVWRAGIVRGGSGNTGPRVEAGVRVVHPGGTGVEHLRWNRQGGQFRRDFFGLAIACGDAVAARIADFGRGLCIGAGAHFSGHGLAAVHAAFCGCGADGVDELSAAIGSMHSVLLPLHDGAVRADWACARAGAHGCSFCGAGCGQQLVAEAVSVWSDGVGVARDDIREAPVVAER